MAVAIRHSGSGIVVMLEVTALLGVVVRVALGIVVAGEFEEVVEMVV